MIAARGQTRAAVRGAGYLRALRSAVCAALAVLGWGNSPGTAFGQEAPRPVRLDAPTATAPATAGTETRDVPAWGPGLEWSPHKPGLVIEPDCFVDAEVAVVFPHLSSVLTAPVNLGGNVPAQLVAVRNARLDPTVAPLIQVGAFRFGPGYGELALSYRLFGTSGEDAFPGADGAPAARVHSRLNFQTFALDYLRNDCPLGDNLSLSWDVGLRLEVVFFDTQVQTADSFLQARNYFFGAGPHAGVGVTRLLSAGLGVYARCDAALVVGYNTTQDFAATTLDPVNGPLSGSATQQQTQLSPSVALQTGLSWTPEALPRARLRVGYQFEQWYNLGRVSSSRGDLNAHELFLNGEVTF
jgi:hypothetical protein